MSPLVSTFAGAGIRRYGWGGASGGRLFVAIPGDYGNVAATSPDGATWTSRTLAGSDYYNSGTYGPSGFVTVGRSAISSRSVDGITWSYSTLTTASAQWVGVAYGAGKYVAVSGYNGNYNSVNVSTDGGATWAGTYYMPTTRQYKAVAYGSGVWVAIAMSSAYAAVSSDGYTWTDRSLPASGTWQLITSSGSTFLTVNSAIGTSGATSPDGLSWTTRTLPFAPSAVGYGAGLFVIAYATTGATSPDGITWTNRTFPASVWWSSITYANGKFVAVSPGTGSTGNIAATSSDGITWTAQTLPSSIGWNTVI